MKKAFLVIITLSVISMCASGQDYRTSLGVRLGYPYGLTVKHFVSKKSALEGILASSWGGFVATALYENENWTGKYPSLNWYLGVGAHAGFWDQGSNPNVDDTYSGSIIGADFVIGLEYTFDEIPVNLSVDLLPTYNLIGYRGWGGLNGAISARYVF